MKKTLRGTIGAAVATIGLVAAAVPAGAFTVDPIMHNDLNLKSLPSPQLNMGGSSFDANLVQAAETKWQTDTAKAAFSAYQSTKSGVGRASVISGAYNIGFSDFPMNLTATPDVGPGSADPSETLANYVQVPVALGGVAIIFNMGSTASNALRIALAAHPLQLTGPVLGQIFAGKIKYWDAAAIANINPLLKSGGVTLLPHQSIAVESRTSGSGTTFMFTDYLSRVDHTDFPAATANSFTAAVATSANSAALDAAVRATDGAVGYVEYGYAIANHNQVAVIQNKSGKYVLPTATALTAAAAAGLVYINAHGGFKTSALNNFSINNELGLTVYPIAGFSFGIVKKNQTNLKAGIAIVKFLDFLVHQGGGTTKLNTFGQDLAAGQGYAPMPVALQTISRNLIKTVTNAGHPILSATN